MSVWDDGLEDGDDTEDQVPEHLHRQVREQLGDEIADKFANALGGLQVWIPHPDRLRETSVFVQAVGMKTAAAIARLFVVDDTGVRITVPIPKTNQRSLIEKSFALFEKGESIPKIARMHNAHERTIYRHRRYWEREKEASSPNSSLHKRLMDLFEVESNVKIIALQTGLRMIAVKRAQIIWKAGKTDAA